MHVDFTPTVGLIYFAQGKVTRLVKIGFTTDLAKRLEAFRCHSAEEVNILATVNAEQRMERGLHLVFKTARVRGEWFEMTPELAALVDDLRESGGEEPFVAARERRERRARKEEPAIRLWDLLEVPMSLKELSDLSGVQVETARKTMKRHPDRFAQFSTEPTSVPRNGRPPTVWARAVPDIAT